MGNNQYLIPANSKNSMLILGLFNTVDLIICGTGMTLTIILLLIIKADTLQSSIIILLPLLLSAFLVIPLPNQHNVRTFIKNIWNYFLEQREYHWKGWCIRDGEDAK